MSDQKIKKFLMLFIFCGVLFRTWGIERPWGTKDHYNYGGVYTSAAARCLKKTPFTESRGVPHVLCETKEPAYYPNHPPTVLYGIGFLTTWFGDTEWANRLFTLIFSVLNIYLVFVFARRIWPATGLAPRTEIGLAPRMEIGLAPRMEIGLAPYWAAAFQALTLGGIYFGTHLDFFSEFTISFCLLSGIAAMAGMPVWAVVWAWVAGLTGWPGYLMLGVLVGFYFWKWVYARRGDKDLKSPSPIRSLAVAAVGVAIGVATMLWTMSYLTKAPSVVEFLLARLTPNYQAGQASQMAIVTLGKFIKNVLVSLSRLLSPFLATVFLFELGRRVVRLGDKRLGGSNGVSGLESSKKTQAQESWRSRLGEALAPTPFRQGLFLAGGTWCLLALVGYRGMMVHVFEYLFLIPAAALTFARWVTEKGWESWNSSRVNERQTGRGARWWILGAAFVITAVYPFGIYQSSLTHDVINSAILVLTSLGFFATQRLWSPRGVLMALALTGVANFSQTVNYRLEPDAGRAFCLQAREEHARTGQPVRTQEPRTMAKDLYYCAGIPVVYEGENK